jgi:hypothetical protein
MQFRVIMSEPTNNIVDTMTFYGTPDDPLMDFPFNVNFVFDINNQTNASTLKFAIDKWIDNMPTHATANWVVSIFIQSVIYETRDKIKFGKLKDGKSRSTKKPSAPRRGVCYVLEHGESFAARHFHHLLRRRNQHGLHFCHLGANPGSAGMQRWPRFLSKVLQRSRKNAFPME